MGEEHDAAIGELDDILSDLNKADETPAEKPKSAAEVVRRIAEQERLDESRIQELIETLKKEEIRTVHDLVLLPRTAWVSLGVPLGLAYKIQDELGARSDTPPSMSPLSSTAPSTFLLNTVGERPPSVVTTPISASSASVAPTSAPASSIAPSSKPPAQSSPLAIPVSAARAPISTQQSSSPSSAKQPSPRPAPKAGGWAGAKPSSGREAQQGVAISAPSAGVASPRQVLKSYFPSPPSSSASDADSAALSTSLSDQPRRLSPVNSPRNPPALSAPASVLAPPPALSQPPPVDRSAKPTTATPLQASRSKEDQRVITPSSSPSPPAASSPVSAASSPITATPISVASAESGTSRQTVETLLAFADLRSAPPSSQLSASAVAALFEGALLSYSAYSLISELAASRRWIITRIGLNKETQGGEVLRVQIPTQALFLLTISPNPPHLSYPPLPSSSARSVSPSITSASSANTASSSSSSPAPVPSLSLSQASPRKPSVGAPAVSPRSRDNTSNALMSPRAAEGAHTLYKRRLLQSRMWADVLVNFNGIKFAAHSYVLLVRADGLLSSKDRSVLEKRKKKHENSPYHLEFSAKEVAGLPVSTLELVMDYIYTGETTNLARLPARELVALSSAAHRFKLERLLWLTERALRQVLTNDNVHGAMRLAADLNEAELVRVCMLYALLHYSAFIASKPGITHVGIDLYSDVVRQAAQIPEKQAEALFAEHRSAPPNDYVANWQAILDEMACADGVARFVWGMDSHQRPLLLGDRIRFHKPVLACLSDALTAYIREAPTEEVLFFITPDSFRALLRYVYTADAAFTVHQAADLFPFAQRTHTTDLFKIIDDRIRDPAELTAENVLHILSVTYLPYMRDRADMQRVRAAALAFFFENITQVDLAPLRHLPQGTAIELIFAAQQYDANQKGLAPP